MSIAISSDHVTLAETASDFLRRHDARGAARALLESPEEDPPKYWAELCALGWLGLHIPEEHGGSGYGIPELVVVIEEMGRALAPGPFVSSAIVSAVIAEAGKGEIRDRVLPGLAEGSSCGAVALRGDFTVSGGKVSGSGVALGSNFGQVLMVAAGDDVAVVDTEGDGVTIETPKNLDPTRRTSRVTLTDAPADVIAGGRQALVDLSRVILSAEATGIARECTELASGYAKERLQFGRVIGTYQAVKHHCANMAVAAELSTALVWDAANAASIGGDQLSYAAAMAATVAIPAADLCTNLNMQVHGGIGFTWEHDAHMYMRRASVLGVHVDADEAAADVTNFARNGVTREKSIDLPPEAESIRDEVRAFVNSIGGLDQPAQRQKMIDEGYVMPHWPKPWGRDAGAVEQLVVEQEFADAKIKRPGYGITGWVILTLIQHATEDQVQRWVPTALTQEVIWCQLFSEPDAGSDAAGIKTRGTKVDGGWKINGQKVWTSQAHEAGMGLATIRTDPDVPKHNGITTMVIDMHAEGVEVRPLRMTTGGAEFNEVFFNDVFVPDDDVVGPVNGGWTVARATLGNESVSIGGGQGLLPIGGEMFIPPYDADPERLPGGAQRIGRHISTVQATGMMNLRSAHRAVAGAEPGPEGAITKLVLSEVGHEAASMMAELMGDETAFMDGPGAMAGGLILMHRAMSIAGGTSEIKRNQIGERICGLPRDPLIDK